MTTDELLAGIADLARTRDDVAKMYGDALRRSDPDSIDWERVNRAILDRWSRAGLIYVKDKAWERARRPL